MRLSSSFLCVAPWVSTSQYFRWQLRAAGDLSTSHTLPHYASAQVSQSLLVSYVCTSAVSRKPQDTFRLANKINNTNQVELPSSSCLHPPPVTTRSSRLPSKPLTFSTRYPRSWYVRLFLLIYLSIYCIQGEETLTTTTNYIVRIAYFLSHFQV